MTVSEVGRRYAKALFESMKDRSKLELTLSDLREIEKVFAGNEELKQFFQSPIIAPELKTKALGDVLRGKTSQEIINFLQMLIEMRRIEAFSEILTAFQELCDGAHGVTRGQVRSSTPLGPEDRKRIEETVKKATGKDVILSFEVDPSVLGGLVARVAGFTFDDSLSTHLLRVNDELNRRVV